MSLQESNCTMLVNFEGSAPGAKELREALEKGDLKTKVDTMKKVIMLQLNGEPQNHLIMTVIKYCVPQEDHILKKLLIYFFESVDKTDASGKLLPEMILLCSFLRNDLQHPNEFVRGITLRFLTKLKERDILEPLVSSVVLNLSHRVTYVRRNAVLAIQSIFSKFPQLLPDAAELIDNMLNEQQDVSTKRNAFVMLFTCAQERAARYLTFLKETGEIANAGEVFQLAVVEAIKQLIQSNPYDKSKYVPTLFAVLQTKSSSVLYQCATTLLSLTSSPTAIKHAATTFIQLLTTHSDNNVRLIVLDRLSEMKQRFLPALQESIMDILRGVATSNADIRKRVIDLALELVTGRNIDAFVQFLKKELVRSQSEDIGDKAAQQDYRQLIVRAIHKSVIQHTRVAGSVVPIMLDYICEPGASSYDIIIFIREVMHSQPELRDELLGKLLGSFPMIASPKVLRAVLWLFGVYCKTAEQIINIIGQLRKSLEPLPLTSLVQPVVTSQDGEEGPQAVATTTVREDGTYVMSITMVDKRTEHERSDLTGLRSQICGGDYFLAATLANTLAKLIVELFDHHSSHISAGAKNSAQVDCLDIMREIIRFGTSTQAPLPLDDDSHQRIRLCMTITQNPRNEFLRTMADESLGAFGDARAVEHMVSNGGNTATDEEELAFTAIDLPMQFSQLLRGKNSALDFEAANDELSVAISNDAIAGDQDFVNRLHRTVQLSGFNDAVYAEALVTVHEFDVLVELFLTNQTQETLQNLTVELATLGDLKLCERPQTYIVPPRATASIRANIKVSSTETGTIFGNIVYDVGSVTKCIVLNEMHIDIMDYIHPHACSANDFRNMWMEFEWENKVVVNTDVRDLRDYVELVTRHTNMRPLDGSLYGECDFLSINLAARSLFGEDALANVSIERDPEGKIEGIVRIRSKTQGIALGLGEKVNIKQKNQNPTK